MSAVDDLARTLKETLQGLAKAGAGAAGAGGRAFSGAPSQSVILMVKDRHSGKMVPIEWDAEGQGLALAGTLGITFGAVTVGSLPTIATNGNGGSRKITSGTLGAADALLYTALQHWTDVSIIIANADAANRTFQFYHGAKADGNLVYTKDALLVAGDPPVIVHGLGLRTGETFRGQCDSADKVAYSIWGTPVTANA